MSLQSRYISANGIEFHYLEQGEGAPVLMLHGFPDHAAAWRPLADRLALSFRVIAPDLRGYGQTSRPLAVADYRLDLLIDDIFALLDALGLAQVHLCGHDWGGVLAFAFADKHPGRVASLTALNAPPIAVLQDMIWTDPVQRAASQYITTLRSDDADAIFDEANVEKLVDRFLSKPRRRGLLNDEDMAAYRRAWTQPAVWQAMLAWYRAAPLDVPAITAHFTGWPAMQGTMNISPVLLIGGDKDTVFVPALADAIALACRNCRVERLSSAGHVPHRDEPDRCAALISGFLSDHPFQLATEE